MKNLHMNEVKIKVKVNLWFHIIFFEVPKEERGFFIQYISEYKRK